MEIGRRPDPVLESDPVPRIHINPPLSLNPSEYSYIPQNPQYSS